MIYNKYRTKENNEREENKMTNYKNLNVELTRIDVCDLLLACTLMQTGKDGKKWATLHDKLQKQLRAFDKENDKAKA